MTEQKLYAVISNSEPINKGWSEDKKYCVTVADFTQYLLCVTPISRYETRKSLAERSRRQQSIAQFVGEWRAAK